MPNTSRTTLLYVLLMVIAVCGSALVALMYMNGDKQQALEFARWAGSSLGVLVILAIFFT